MRVGADASADDDDLAAHVALDGVVEIVEPVLPMLDDRDLDCGEVELQVGPAIDHEEAVVLTRLLHRGDENVGQAQLLRHLRRRLLRLLGDGYGKDEGDLNDAVVLAIAIGPDEVLLGHAGGHSASRISRKGLK